MTGHGQAEASSQGWSARVEVRSVNHRHLDVDLRGTPLPAALGAAVRKQVQARLSRGKCEVHVSLTSESSEPPKLRVDRELATAYLASVRELVDHLGVSGEITVDHLSWMPWGRLIELDDTESEPAPGADEVVSEALDGALGALVEARRLEGEVLATEFGERIASVRTQLERLQAAAATLREARHAKLSERLKELLGELPLDEARVMQEAALLAERADIAEELCRLTAHLERIETLLAGDGPAGKTIDFTLQESLREAHAMGSKCRDSDLAESVITIKSELERLREQVANVE
ncbi:MAG: YicC/YloC family endoribonuclease [Acidobacteriota bacterium]